jgi:hypothetical protein
MNLYEAETYLRICAEQSLLAADRDSSGDSVAEHARALTTVGVIDIPLARRVIEDYTRARALRGRRETDEVVVTRPADGRPRRVVACQHAIAITVGSMKVRYVTFEQAETRVALTITIDPAKSSAPENESAAVASGTQPAITVTDDRGTTVTSSDLEGEWSDSQREWSGFLTLRPALSPDTQWIELVGAHIDLPPDRRDLAIAIEHFGDTDAVDRYLNQCLSAVGNQASVTMLQNALAALEAAGLIDHDTAMKMTTIDHALRGFSSPPPEAGPWHSLLTRRGATGGPLGTLPLGVTTPYFDGISVTFLDLVSADEEFQCEFALAGSADLGVHHDPDLTATLVTFAALDDRGNFYLGDTAKDDCVDDSGTASGTLRFRPALDPLATSLDLIVTTDRARATVTVPLTWEATP